MSAAVNAPPIAVSIAVRSPPMRQAATGLDIVRRAIAGGYGERDLSAIAAFLREEGAR